MNALLWLVQILLALHTVAGAAWKWSNPEAIAPGLQTLPHGLWLALSGLELLCSLGLIAPIISRRLAWAVSAAAALIAAEMLFFSAWNLSSGPPDGGAVTYWIVVAAVAVFVAIGRRTRPTA